MNVAGGEVPICAFAVGHVFGVVAVAECDARIGPDVWRASVAVGDRGLCCVVASIDDGNAMVVDLVFSGRRTVWGVARPSLRLGELVDDCAG